MHLSKVLVACDDSSALTVPTRNPVDPPIELSTLDTIAALVNKQQRSNHDDLIMTTLMGIGGHEASDRQELATARK
jgi:hypothetical protein